MDRRVFELDPEPPPGSRDRLEVPGVGEEVERVLEVDR
jgi:hypothetical protein